MNDSAATRSYDQISPTMRAFIGARAVLRCLEFVAEDLFCMMAANRFGVLSGFCVLKTQDKEFSIELGPCDEGFLDEYQDIAYVIRAGGVKESDLNRMFQESEAYQKLSS